ncbi:MAG: hypothetical protein HY429_04145 [Candidatus Levybacteria bacterium]|nr:hypothetical protein [Candidatus Levybacteria bacterium]
MTIPVEAKGIAHQSEQEVLDDRADAIVKRVLSFISSSPAFVERWVDLFKNEDYDARTQGFTYTETDDNGKPYTFFVRYMPTVNDIPNPIFALDFNFTTPTEKAGLSIMAKKGKSFINFFPDNNHTNPVREQEGADRIDTALMMLENNFKLTHESRPL